MTAGSNEAERELAFRCSAGIDVTLLWNQKNRKVRVTAFEARASSSSYRLAKASSAPKSPANRQVV